MAGASDLNRAKVIKNENSAVLSRRDYTAFGEESITAERAAGLGYSSSQDGVRKGYTGYEKDTGSGLDFAQARYYNSVSDSLPKTGQHSIYKMPLSVRVYLVEA